MARRKRDYYVVLGVSRDATEAEVKRAFRELARVVKRGGHLYTVYANVEGLLVYFVLRYQRRAAEEHPEQYHGHTRLEITWTVIPALILAIVFALTIQTMGTTGPTNPPGEGITIGVNGVRWWWEIQYDEGTVKTASELHIPAGQVVNVNLRSDNVIHSFWVPQLAGKTDVIPNRQNSMWVEPYATGTYLGNCAEYCGVQHAKMLLRVVVESPEEFANWIASQRAPAVEDPAVPAGRALFMKTSCVNCHRVAGTAAGGIFGPDLTRLMTRETIGPGAAPNTSENLRAWMRDPQTIKPGCLMPNMQLTQDEVTRIVAYLQTLK
jgi:cytochrome c oxidase subunit 2